MSGHGYGDRVDGHGTALRTDWSMLDWFGERDRSSDIELPMTNAAVVDLIERVKQLEGMVWMLADELASR